MTTAAAAATATPSAHRRRARAAAFAGLAALAPALAPGLARADGFDTLGALSDRDFERLAEELGAVTHHRGIAPAEPLGLIGFDVAVEVSASDVDDALFGRATGGDLDHTLVVPRVHVQKGLPFNIDVGAMLGAALGTGGTLLGAEVRYALLEGGVATPAISVRGSYSSLQGADELDASNYGLEVGISKGFLMLTPYAGVGVVRTEASAPENPELDDASVNQRKLFAGLNVNLGANLGAEIDRTGDVTTFSAKLGFRF